MHCAHLPVNSVLHDKEQRGNSSVKIEGGGGKRLYLYIVKIGNFPEILMPSLKQCLLVENSVITLSIKNLWDIFDQLSIGTSHGFFLLAVY